MMCRWGGWWSLQLLSWRTRTKLINSIFRWFKNIKKLLCVQVREFIGGGLWSHLPSINPCEKKYKLWAQPRFSVSTRQCRGLQSIRDKRLFKALCFCNWTYFHITHTEYFTCALFFCCHWQTVLIVLDLRKNRRMKSWKWALFNSSVVLQLYLTCVRAQGTGK